jgi:hypothetical protein
MTNLLACTHRALEELFLPFCKSYAQSTTQMASAYYYTPAAGNPQNPNMASMHNMNQMQIGIQPNAYGQPPYRGQVPINDPSVMRKRMPSKVEIDSLQNRMLRQYSDVIL